MELNLCKLFMSIDKVGEGICLGVAPKQIAQYTFFNAKDSYIVF